MSITIYFKVYNAIKYDFIYFCMASVVCTREFDGRIRIINTKIRTRWSFRIRVRLS